MTESLTSRGKLPLGALIAAVGLLCTVLPSTAAAPLEVLVSAYETGRDFHAGGRYDHAVLEVSGEDVEYRRVFAAGETPTIGLHDPRGRALPDGTYTWRLSLIPDMAQARELRAAAEANGGEAPRPWSARSGSFTLAAGSFVAPDLVEATAKRREVRPAIKSVSPSQSEAGPPARDTDTEVAAGFCEADAQKSAAAETRAAPFGAGLVAADNTAQVDSDAAVTAGDAPVEATIRLPAAAAPAARPTASATDGRGEGRDPR